MKSILIFALTMVVSLFSLSQDVISLSYTRSDAYFLNGENDYSEVIKNGSFVDGKEVVEQKVINLSKMETNYYQNGDFVKTYKIQDVKEENGIFYITYKENDVRNGNTIITTQIVDINKKTSFYCWYWDGDENSTIVVKETNLEMGIN
jgi:hypothetical protein